MPLLPYNTVPARAERTYITKETTFGTYVQADNTHSCRSTRTTLTPSIPLITRHDKTGSLSQTAGIKGRIYGTWSIEMDFTGNGVVGTAPDCAILLASAFGQDGASVSSVNISAVATTTINGTAMATATVTSTTTMTTGQTWTIGGVTQTVGTGWANGQYVIIVVDGTHIGLVASPVTGTYTVSTATATMPGVLYTLSDAPYSFDLWSYRNINGVAGTVEQRVAGSCVTTSLEVTFGGDFSTLTARGDCLCVLDSGYFSSASTPEKGGLGSFPVEPAAPVTNGYPAPGFVGLATIGTQAILEIKTGTFAINTGRRLIRDSFGSYIPTGIEAAERSIMLDFTTDDTDSAALLNIKTASKTKTPISYSVLIGNVAGDEFVFSANNLILQPPAIGEQSVRYQDRFSGGQSFASTYTAKDELFLIAQ